LVSPLQNFKKMGKEKTEELVLQNTPVSGEKTTETVNVAELIEAKRKAEDERDEALELVATQGIIIEQLSAKLEKPVDKTKSSVEIDGITYVVTEENQTIKSILEDGVSVKIEDFTAVMVEKYVKAGLLEVEE